jgi:16S rRNA processing protein RimM
MTDPRDDDPAASLLAVGYIAAAHGVRGGVRVQLYDPHSPALALGRRVTLRRDDRLLTTHEVRSADPIPGKPGRFRVSLNGVPGRDQADALRGCELLVARDELPALAHDEFYLADAIGLPVEREHHGQVQALGTVVGLTSNGVQDLFEVEWRGPDGRAHAWLLPVLPQHIVEVEQARVLVDLPQGLLPDALEADEDDPAPGSQ